MPPDADAATPVAPTPDLVELLAREVQALEAAERRGDLAELRRMNPERPNVPAFFRMLVRHRPDAGPDFARRCARIVHLLALRPDALHRGSLGEAMAVNGISEARAQKLLAARGEALATQIALIARRLAQERALPYRELGHLLLADDDSESADRTRLRIARDYFRALDRAPATDAT
ncbi:MAG: type I-E CRISPR-associated protein Cse2/CasB [Labrys sp. (in: a-proteobacteria)]